MKTTVINGANVTVFDRGDWSVSTLLSLALNSDNFSIEHEQDADYGRTTIYTLDDGFWAHVREISEHQIENEELGDRFGLAFVKTEDNRYRFTEGDQGDEIVVRFWKVEAYETDENTWTITANGTPMGQYSGKTEMDAAEAYARDAGYDDIDDAAATLGVSREKSSSTPWKSQKPHDAAF